MIGSVRTRLTVAVVAVVGGLAIGSAIIAPRLVDDALTDDRLDAEVDAEVDALSRDTSVIDVVGSSFDSAGLTAFFGPEIAAVTTALEPTGALDEIRTFRSDDRLMVSPVPGVIGTVQPDGRVRVDASPDGAAGPIVTTSRLNDLAIDLGVSPFVDNPFDLFADGDLTIEDFLADLGSRVVPDLDERFDATVLDRIPAIIEGDLPPDIFDELEEQLQSALDRGFVPPPPAEVVTPISTDDVVFGVRSVGEHEVIVAASTDGISRSVDRVRTALWLAVPFVMLVAGGLTWLLAGRTLRPVRDITRRTSRIRSGTLHERVPVPSSRDEIAGLAMVMNDMLDRVQREDDRRRQFVADASHELRSPIAAIRTQAEATLADAVSPDTTELASGVLAEAERMGVLVDDLLSLARHDEELAPPGGPVDLDDLVLADARRLRRVPVDTSAVSGGRVRGRVDELARVVTHLIDNAARHAVSTVAVALDTSAAGIVTLTVDDDGPGVPPDQRERVFDRFVRLDEARERDAGGAGLGLAVVASVVRSSGGRVRVIDSVLGGARFEVTLPASS